MEVPPVNSPDTEVHSVNSPDTEVCYLNFADMEARHEASPDKVVLDKY